MNSSQPEALELETRQAENNLFQQMAKVQQPMQPETEPQEQKAQS
jgi:hypothetical protein